MSERSVTISMVYTNHITQVTCLHFHLWVYFYCSCGFGFVLRQIFHLL